MWNKMKKGYAFGTVILTLGLLLCCQAAFGDCLSTDPSSPVGIVPTEEAFPGGGPTCSGGKRLTPGDGVETIVFNLDGITGNDVTVTITIGACGEVMSWSVPDNIVIDKIYAKGSTTRNVYDYSGENPRPTSDGNLHCPVTSSGKYAGFSHIDFCYHYKLTINKTATTDFTRTYDWAISKSCDGPNPLTLSSGQTYNYPFSWTASVSDYTDSEWKVTGTITIANNTPFDATIESVSDELTGGITPTPDCGVTYPYVLASNATLNCSYSADLTGADDGTNTVTVVTSTAKVEGGTATADYTFGDPTTLVDECIIVTDDCGGSVEVCYDTAPHTENYICPVGPYDVCGDYDYTNTASFTTTDQNVPGSDTCVVAVNVPCIGGCTLTQGYWKTHSIYGPAPYDDTWASVGEDSLFFLSGQSYYEVLWTPPSGNAYYILAHQYIAAELNFLNGADPTDAQSEFDSATGLFETKTPDDVAGLKGKAKKEWVDLAAVLDYYNNGLTGPGHCDEE